MYKTRQGRNIRAVMQNREMAASLGVNTKRIDSMTFAIGSGLAGLAGCALTWIGAIGPTLGTNYIVDTFMTVVVGGGKYLRFCAGSRIYWNRTDSVRIFDQRFHRQGAHLRVCHRPASVQAQRNLCGTEPGTGRLEGV